MSRFIHFNEQDAESFQTSALQRVDVPRVARVVLAIKEDYLAQVTWIREPYKGSITLRSEKHPGQVVKVFVDYGNKLASKCGVSIHENPIVVGLEMTEQCAFVRECIRNELNNRFSYYIDPRKGNGSKWWLKPIDHHKYDILFLERGECEFEPDRSECDELIMEIEQEILRHERDVEH